MCDFADDPEQVRKLLVGRVLTVERVRQLNAKDYFYQMLKGNPEMLKIRPGVENELLEGAIDCHIHAYPDFVPRAQDMIQIALDASKAKMRALAFKDHWNISCNAAYMAQQHIDNPAKLVAGLIWKSRRKERPIRRLKLCRNLN